MFTCSRFLKDGNKCQGEAEMYGGYCDKCKDEVYGTRESRKKKILSIKQIQDKLLDYAVEARNDMNIDEGKTEEYTQTELDEIFSE